jgi:DNA-binding NarL/FixJ family response regulator
MKLGDTYRENIKLSQRQMEILTQLSKGLNYIQIADNLFISPGTVRKHIENIYNGTSSLKTPIIISFRNGYKQ